MDTTDGAQVGQAAISALIAALVIGIPGLLLYYFLREAGMNKKTLARLERVIAVVVLVSAAITFLLNY